MLVGMQRRDLPSCTLDVRGEWSLNCTPCLWAVSLSGEPSSVG